MPLSQSKRHATPSWMPLEIASIFVLVFVNLSPVQSKSLTATKAANTNLVSGWFTSWDSRDRLTNTFNNLSQLDTVWLFGPSAEGLLPKNDQDSKGKAEPWWTDLEPLSTTVGRARAAKIRYGPVLHNSGEKGFDPDLAVKLFAEESKVIERLLAEFKKHQWTALNVDLEAVPVSSAAAYEKFLKSLVQSFSKLPVKISVCLHAQTEKDPQNEAAKFQRWKVLSEIPVEYLIMGYDHSWSNSPPGPIAPLDWLERIVEKAQNDLKPGRWTMGLPLYGYHWKKGKNDQWSGIPDVSPVLNQRIRGEANWKKDEALPKSHGQLYRQADQAIAFDDDESVLLKIEALRKKGLSKFALWRLEGASGLIYKSFHTEPSKVKSTNKKAQATNRK